MLGCAFAFAVAACGPDDADDRFARAFIASLSSRDSAAARLLEPGSELQEDGWGAVLSHRKYLPQSSIETIVLTDWERVFDRHGAARKLSYEVRSREEYSILQIWLVSKDGRRFVNTIQTNGPSPLPR